MAFDGQNRIEEKIRVDEGRWSVAIAAKTTTVAILGHEC